MIDINETTLNAACVRAAEGLVRLATERDMRVSTAESCTAGMVSSYIAGVPGASAVLLGGAVTYCDDIKNHVLDVPAKTLENHTAVSGETASAMADGSRKQMDSEIAGRIKGLPLNVYYQFSVGINRYRAKGSRFLLPFLFYVLEVCICYGNFFSNFVTI